MLRSIQFATVDSWRPKLSEKRITSKNRFESISSEKDSYQFVAMKYLELDKLKTYLKLVPFHSTP
jgi:hypothetical protein